MATRVAHVEAPGSYASAAAAILRRLDYVLLAVMAGLIAYGLWVLGAVSRNDVPGEPDYYLIRQAVNVTIGAIAFVAVTFVNPEMYRRYRKPLYLAILVLLAVVLFADAIRGTQRWI
ncbi:MAG: FtsW/RodA/SpoVE family cell cycle protein, partial [Actinomycetota bacterium]|nr:FtsW/RodA/SpoVE family cell cycle protein [Actinomycetota bacterium]